MSARQHTGLKPAGAASGEHPAPESERSTGAALTQERPSQVGGKPKFPRNSDSMEGNENCVFVDENYFIF